MSHNSRNFNTNYLDLNKPYQTNFNWNPSHPIDDPAGLIRAGRKPVWNRIFQLKIVHQTGFFTPKLGVCPTGSKAGCAS